MNGVAPIAQDSPTPAPPLARGRVVLKRLLTVAAGFGVFVLVASVVDPQSSPASPGDMVVNVPHLGTDRQQAVEQRLLARRHPMNWPTLGLLEGPEYLTLIHSSPDGPRYTICALNGRVLLEDLPADDVYRAFPTLDLAGMRLDPADPPGAHLPDGGALMLADPGAQFPD